MRGGEGAHAGGREGGRQNAKLWLHLPTAVAPKSLKWIGTPGREGRGGRERTAARSKKPEGAFKAHLERDRTGAETFERSITLGIIECGVEH